MTPETDRRGWISSLYVSGEAISKKIAEDFYKYETDVYLFSNSSRVADARGLALGYLNQTALATWIHSGEGVLPPDLADPASWATNIANFFVCDKIYAGSMYGLELLGRELQPSEDECGRYTPFAQKILEKFEALPTVYECDHDIIDLKPKHSEIPLILWAGRTDFDKNPTGFARMVLELDKRGVQFNLALATKEERQPPIWKQMKEELGSRIFFKGFAKGDEYKLLLKRADIVLAPSLTENLALAVNEAVYAGAIPLVSDVGGFKYMFEGRYRFRDEKYGIDRLQRFCELVQSGDTSSIYEELYDYRKGLRNHTWSILKQVYLDSFKRFWLERESRIPTTPANSTKKAMAYIDQKGVVSKRELLNEALHWSGMDYYSGLRWKLLNNGYRTSVDEEGTDKQEVVWYRAKDQT